MTTDPPRPLGRPATQQPDPRGDHGPRGPQAEPSAEPAAAAPADTGNARPGRGRAGGGRSRAPRHDTPQDGSAAGREADGGHDRDHGSRRQDARAHHDDPAPAAPAVPPPTRQDGYGESPAGSEAYSARHDGGAAEPSGSPEAPARAYGTEPVDGPDQLSATVYGTGWMAGTTEGSEALRAFVSTPPRGTALDAAGHPADEDSTGMRIPMPVQTGPEADRLRYVGAATRRIARGLDLDEILLGLCRSAVPAFADAILVYLREPLPVGDERPSGPLRLRLRRADGSLDGPDGEEEVPVGSLPALETPYGGAPETIGVLLDGPLAEVLRGVRPVFTEYPRAADALAELLGNPGVPLPSGRRALLAPLRGRRRVIGAAVLLRRADSPPFEADDLLIAAQLATHTALGVDKAVLYGREAYIADALQREMLPDSLPQPTGVQLASRYLPAAESARVGGDWYDAIPLPGSRVALVVGDVMGHSMTSAAIMGQLRTTVQTLAGLDLAPQEVLYHLDEQAQRLGEDRMATCVYAVYDPIAHRMVVANAGHPPPVLLHADGTAEVLKVPPGAPIGVGGVPFEAVELPAPAGATLLLYTDGLVESRSRDVWGGIELLRERLHDAAAVVSPPPLEPLCDEVLEILGPGDRDDDIALLAARFAGIAPSDVAYWFLEPQAQTAGRARRLVRQALRRWGLEEQVDAAELLVSEIVTNAVRYAERPVTLRLLRTDVLRCEVGDDAPLLPRMRHAAPEEEGGRGLYLVNRMAQRWGATRLGAGKVVWFELPL
ncbi:ATP-binding SpoIIE family protein phosphatase [Actinacidiphila yeochonensis]|uniref:ATP-binding SpoIIE family protein phosphatase n=1 Tax=Actinacidiphila yeochonensis TaxID=89050 RepID=UPI000A67A385|nr:SpoIIE family protein phosphatase [Actinacidiphila yeochonensis]